MGDGLVVLLGNGKRELGYWDESRALLERLEALREFREEALHADAMVGSKLDTGVI